MIFPKVSLIDWMKKHPELEILSKKCDNCDKILRSVKPFVDGIYAGLIACDCLCNKNRHTCVSMICLEKDWELS